MRQRRAAGHAWGVLAALTAALSCGGCSLVLAPDRSQIIYESDGGMDAGRDGGLDAATDAAVDAGSDGAVDACPGQAYETSCTNDVDEDCNGLVDCADFRCAADPSCCDPRSGGPWVQDPTYQIRWDQRPEGAFTSGCTGAQTDCYDANEVRFGTGSPEALLFHSCAPLAYGMHLDVSFRIRAMTSRGDYAALVLTPASEMTPGEGFVADMALRVRDDGTAVLERAGTELGSATVGLTDQVASVDLSPGVNDDGRGVLYVTAKVGDNTLADHLALMPLSDLLGGPACVPDGLNLAIEGKGTSVWVTSPVTADQGQCQNPSQFAPDTTLDPIVPGLASGSWRNGGAGEPTVQHFAPVLGAEQVEVWVDASEQERGDELLELIPFSIGGAQTTGGSWAARSRPGSGGDPRLLGPMPSSREPSLAAPLDGSGVLQSGLFVAYAHDPTAMGERYDVYLSQVGTDANAPLDTPYPVLQQEDVSGECESLRDPALVSLGGAPQTDGFLLFFTCEPPGIDEPRIGVARLAYDTGSREYRASEVVTDLITRDIGDYAFMGASAPEVVYHPGSGSVRVWFLARSASGTRRLAFARGVLTDDQTLPRVAPFPGNPILEPDDDVLGSADCSAGCTLDAAAVTTTLPSNRLWSMHRYYVLVVARSVTQSDGSLVHELILLDQKRPAGE